MARCIELARGGAGHTAPNPMVGAVIVHAGRIIGEGFHRRCGEAHAEVNAIAAVRDESLLADATIYVSLEPCSHYGKTPPCAELIIRKRIPRVVVGCLDPFPEVSGRGVKMLREAGVEVVTGVMEREAQALNRPFLTMQCKHRPFVLLKWAESADGFIDRLRTDAKEAPFVFSSPETRRLVHKLRAEVGAVLVGTRTALLDNPSLTVRDWAGRQPLRVVIDRDRKIPADYHLMDGTTPTLVITAKACEERENLSFARADFSLPLVPRILQLLADRKVDSLLVEGGSRLLEQFLASGLWDEARVETAPVNLRAGVVAPDMRPYPVAGRALSFPDGRFITVYRPEIALCEAQSDTKIL